MVVSNTGNLIFGRVLFFVRFFGSSILHPYHVVRLILYSFQIGSNWLPKNTCEASLMISIVLLTCFLTIICLTKDHAMIIMGYSFQSFVNLMWISWLINRKFIYRVHVEMNKKLAVYHVYDLTPVQLLY